MEKLKIILFVFLVSCTSVSEDEKHKDQEPKHGDSDGTNTLQGETKQANLHISVSGVPKCKYLKPKLGDSCTIIQHILEEENEQEYLVYLDRKTWNDDKAALANFSYEESEYKIIGPKCYEILKGRKPNLLPLKLPRHWLQLHQYKGEIVLFCSIECNPKIIFTDSIIAEHQMADFATAIITQTTLKDNIYSFKIIESYIYDKESELILHLIDKEKGLYVWEYKNKGKSSYRLMIPASKVRYYPIIGELSYDAQFEIPVEFESIDFEKLLKQKK